MFAAKARCRTAAAGKAGPHDQGKRVFSEETWAARHFCKTVLFYSWFQSSYQYAIMGNLKMLGVASKKEKKLIENGIAIQAHIKDVAINNSMSVNGRNPRKLICEGTLPDDKAQYYESSNVSTYV